MYESVFGCSFFFSSRRRHTRCGRDWSSDVCSSDLSTQHRPGLRSANTSTRCTSCCKRTRTSSCSCNTTWQRENTASSANSIRASNILRLLGKDRKSTRLNSSHVRISYAVFCLKKKKKEE